MNSRLRVLCVGRLTYYKGVRYLVEAVARVDGVSLAIVGSGDEETALEALIRRLDLSKRVRLLGALPDEALEVELDRCDSLCLPSVERTEAFGVVLLEAMRVAKAVVATAVPGAGMGWLVEDGSVGLLVEPESALALAGALATLRDDETIRATMGAAGRRRFEQHFRINQTTETLSAVYRSVIADN